MNLTDTAPTCNAEDEGRRCNREPVMLRPVVLCEAHRIEVALSVVPGLLRDQLVAAQQQVAAPAPRADLIATTHAVQLDALLGGVHDSVVYFLANGGRVKIGYSTNLRSRLSSLALRSDSLLLALQGGPELERALHAHFTEYRNGTTEWFELAPEIFRYIAAPHPATDTVPTPTDNVVPKGYDAHATAQSAQRAQSVAKATEMLTRNPGLTSGQIAEELGVSPATAKRYLREAKQVHR